MEIYFFPNQAHELPEIYPPAKITQPVEGEMTEVFLCLRGSI